MYRLLFPLLLCLTACYAKTPPRRPQIDLPPVAEGQQLVVQRGTISRYDKYGAEIRIPATEVEYNGERVSRGQLIAMTTPNYEAKGRDYDAKRARCQKFQVPRVIAGALSLGSILFYYYGSQLIPDHRQRLYASIGGWTAGMVVYGFGYIVGGSVCNDATEMYNTYYDDSEDKRFFLDEELKRVNKMVRDYNMKQQATRVSSETAASN